MVGETIAHDKRQRSVIHKMRPGIYSGIDLAVTVGRGQDPEAFFIVKVSIKFHGKLLSEKLQFKAKQGRTVNGPALLNIGAAACFQLIIFRGRY
jgi:hypothetical protein